VREDVPVTASAESLGRSLGEAGVRAERGDAQRTSGFHRDSAGGQRAAGLDDVVDDQHVLALKNGHAGRLCLNLCSFECKPLITPGGYRPAQPPASCRRYAAFLRHREIVSYSSLPPNRHSVVLVHAATTCPNENGVGPSKSYRTAPAACLGTSFRIFSAQLCEEGEQRTEVTRCQGSARGGRCVCCVCCACVAFRTCAPSSGKATACPRRFLIRTD
jgi:hypothetical protein